MTYVEAKFDFLKKNKSVIPSRVTRVCVNIQRLDLSILCRQSKEKGHPFRVLGVLSAMEHIFQRDCNSNKNGGKQASGKGDHGKSWSKSESSITGRGKGKEIQSKGKSNGTEGAFQVSKGNTPGKSGTSSDGTGVYH